MSTIFDYPRNLQNPQKRAIHHLTPPSFVGLQQPRRTRGLEQVLAESVDKFSMSRQLSSTCKIQINLGRDGTRQVFTGRRYWQTAIFPSRKCGRSIISEGPNELLFVGQCEVDVGITEYASQPILFEVRLGSTWKKYHCDFCRLRSDGQIEIVEVKPNASHLDKPAYREKLDAVQEACNSMDWKFTPVFGVDLQKRSYHNFHVKWVQGHRFYAISAADQNAVLRLTASQAKDIFVGDLIEACSGLVQARATLSALICRGRAYLDLGHPISAETPITFINGDRYDS